MQERQIETIDYQADVAARNRPCGAHPCMNEFPGMPSRWCSGCLIEALLQRLKPEAASSGVSAVTPFTVVYVEGHDGKNVAAPCQISGCQYEASPSRLSEAVTQLKGLQNMWKLDATRYRRLEAFELADECEAHQQQLEDVLTILHRPQLRYDEADCDGAGHVWPCGCAQHMGADINYCEKHKLSPRPHPSEEK